MKKINNIAVVGAGTAGLINAIILKKHLNIPVTVIYSKDIPIVGVGEGSTEHFSDFLNFIGVDHKTIIKECDATYKSGVMFKGWSKNDYFHHVDFDFIEKYGHTNILYAKKIIDNDLFLSHKFLWNNNLPIEFLNHDRPFSQFHFNTFKLNDFLIKKAKDFGVIFIDDKILDVKINNKNEIDKLVGEKNSYSYDFYIDSTGFKKILISKLGAKWISYSKYLKMKAAITFQSEDEDNYNIWTLSEAMDFGWRFKIPVWGRHGNGYIYDSDYIGADDAQKEIELKLSKKIEVGKFFNFDPGRLNYFWINNCIAVGLSGSFFEPMEATSIGSSIQQAFLLIDRLPVYSNKTIDQYNKSVNAIMENILDFIALHYMVKKDNSAFWQEIQNSKIPDSLLEKIENWKYSIPNREDFFSSAFLMFTENNFTTILHGLNMFDKNCIGYKYNTIPNDFKKYIDIKIQNIKKYEDNIELISHKDYIKTIRSLKEFDIGLNNE